MRRKEYAVSLGLVKAGRGRMSREALAAIDAAKAKGMVFDDDPTAPKPEPKPTAAPVEGEGFNAYANAFMRYPMDQEFKATDSNGKTHKVNSRQICVPCGLSLVGHRCGAPRVLLGNCEIVPVIPIGE